MIPEELISAAITAREASYSPYSGFAVGAALLTKSGVVYHGCNIENAAFTPTSCAERTAFAKAVSEGAREFTAIAVVGWKHDADTTTDGRGLAFPCGVCRQVMMEFCDPESFRIIVATSPQHYLVYTLAEILPHGFGPADLEP